MGLLVGQLGLQSNGQGEKKTLDGSINCRYHHHMADLPDPSDKSTWQKFKDGFKPANERADQMIADNKAKYGDQYNKDRELGAQNMRDKFKKGFFSSNL